MTDYTDLKARLRARAGKWVEERFGGIVWVLDDPDLPAEALAAIEELEQNAERYLLLRNRGTDILLAAFDGVSYWTGLALDAKLDKERGNDDQ